MKPMVTLAALGAAAIALAAVSGADASRYDQYLRPAKAPEPADNIGNPARVELGKTLFFDPRLSGSNWISCATCHNPSRGWSDGLPTGVGHGMQVLKRATPSLINCGFNTTLMWDGRAPNLEEQALGPIAAAAEMNQDLPGLVSKLSAIQGYPKLFNAAYPGEGISEKTIGKAIAAYERTILSGESPFDRWRKGDARAVDAAAKRGFEVFEGKGKCVKCHEGFNFTDNGFHNIGVKEPNGEVDVGRFAQRALRVNYGAFRTPSLRDVALTAPYMHNGAYATLEEVVEHYDRGGDVTEHLSPNMSPLGLTAGEKSDLVAFMKSLTGKQLVVTLPHLPN
ncbi:tryptophan tryptophylquinone biosynthesis enzyme MauG [Betaproteobacteria bacterium GR16-43]|nr:tryptophan tryptophylquinone biosynthesis enzyme MauG [Betaproteobacteria bacterium GR16-43]